MGIPRKGSRRIVVDGVAFRWILRTAGSRYDRWDDRLPHRRAGTVIVQEESDSPGRPVKFGAVWKGPMDTCSKDGGCVVPAMVERGVRRAMADGWVPGQRGAVLDLPWDLEPDADVVRGVMAG
jgi:hypothetical protein